jgi:DNA-directed RNA polymerase specialized sigma24 family protein
MPSAETFGEFFERRRGTTVRLAHAIVGSNAIAEEIAQEAFLRVHTQWSAIDRPEPFLRVVVVNLCRTHVRRKRLERREASRFLRVAPSETGSVVRQTPRSGRAVQGPTIEIVVGR